MCTCWISWKFSGSRTNFGRRGDGGEATGVALAKEMLQLFSALAGSNVHTSHQQQLGYCVAVSNKAVINRDALTLKKQIK